MNLLDQNLSSIPVTPEKVGFFTKNVFHCDFYETRTAKARPTAKFFTSYPFHGQNIYFHILVFLNVCFKNVILKFASRHDTYVGIF